MNDNYLGRSAVDVLGAIVGSEVVAREALATYGSLRRLQRAPPRDLLSVAGLGPARLRRLRAAFDLTACVCHERLAVGQPLQTPQDVFDAVGPLLAGEDHEVFLALGLDARHRIRIVHRAATGSLTRCVLTPGDVFRPLVREAVASAVLVHNHPSGDPNPSAEDITLTRRMKDAGRLLGIAVLDHVVVAAEGFVSLADRGVL